MAFISARSDAMLSDRATDKDLQECNPSAYPEAGSEGRAACRPLRRPPISFFYFQRQCDKPLVDARDRAKAKRKTWHINWTRLSSSALRPQAIRASSREIFLILFWKEVTECIMS